MARALFQPVPAFVALSALFAACDFGGLVGGTCKKGAICDDPATTGGTSGTPGEDPTPGAGDGEGGDGRSPNFVDPPGRGGRGGGGGASGAGDGGDGDGNGNRSGGGDAGAGTGPDAGAGDGSGGDSGSGNAPSCEEPLVACGSQCVDTNLNPAHCGGCFNACPSGICQAGMCVGATTGHIAVYCMNYATAPTQGTQAVLLANAVFLPIRAEVRILAFTRWAPAAVRSRISSLLSASASMRGRSYVLTEIEDPAELTAELNIQSYDVLMIYEQSSAPAGELGEVGVEWQDSLVLDSFTRAGGVVIALDGAQGTAEMPELLSSSGLLAVDGHAAIATNDSTTRFYNRAPADALAVNVVSPFSPISNSCTFETALTPSAETVFVVTDAPSPDAGEPVVIHRIVVP